MNEKISKLLGLFRESLPEIKDPLWLNQVRFTAGDAAIMLAREHGEMEANRKSFQVALRDRLIAESGEGEGKALSKTAAEEAARAHPEYVAYLERQAAIAVMKEQAELLRDVAAQRAWILTTLMEAEAKRG